MTLTESKNTIAYRVPDPVDVLCGRSHLAFNHPGNRDLRIKIAATLDEYNRCPTRHGKTVLIRSTINFVTNRGGRFLKYDKDKKKWYDGGAVTAKIRVSTAFRDARIPNKVKCMDALFSSSSKQPQETKQSKHCRESPFSPKVFSSRMKTISSSAIDTTANVESVVSSSDIQQVPFSIDNQSSQELEPIPGNSSGRFTSNLPQSELNLKNEISPRSSIIKLTPELMPDFGHLMQMDEISLVEEEEDDELSVSSSVLDGIVVIDDFGAPAEYNSLLFDDDLQV